MEKKASTIKVAIRVRPVLNDDIAKGIADKRDKLQIESHTQVRYVIPLIFSKKTQIIPNLRVFQILTAIFPNNLNFG